MTPKHIRKSLRRNPGSQDVHDPVVAKDRYPHDETHLAGDLSALQDADDGPPRGDGPLEAPAVGHHGQLVRERLCGIDDLLTVGRREAHRGPGRLGQEQALSLPVEAWNLAGRQLARWRQETVCGS